MKRAIGELGKEPAKAHRLNLFLAVALNGVAVASLFMESDLRSLLLTSYFAMFLILAFRIPCGWLIPCTIAGSVFGSASDPMATPEIWVRVSNLAIGTMSGITFGFFADRISTANHTEQIPATGDASLNNETISDSPDSYM